MDTYRGYVIIFDIGDKSHYGLLLVDKGFALNPRVYANLDKAREHLNDMYERPLHSDPGEKTTVPVISSVAHKTQFNPFICELTFIEKDSFEMHKPYLLINNDRYQ